MMNNKRFNILIHTFVFTLFFISLDIIACNGNLCHSACAIDLFKPHTKGNGIKTVVIDAGHGGKDPGCIGVLHKEKDVTLAVALHLGKLIEENLKDVKVIYTRKKDIFVELEERAQIANRNNADLFISIHCNAAATTVTYKDKKGKIRKKEVHNPKPYGSETYVMGIKNEKGNMEVAKRENAAMLLEENYKTTYNGFDPNSDEAYIIMSIYTGAFVEQSAIFASKIQNEYVRKAGRVDKGVHRQSIWVLWRTAMPSILTEVGFLTNPEEEKFLGSDKGQKYLASAIFRALRSYKNDVEGVKINYDDEIENETPLENENKGIVYPTIPSFIDSSSIGNSEENSKKVKEMISAGDQLLKEGKFEDALKQYKSAKAIDNAYPEIIEKISNAEKKLVESKKQEEEKKNAAFEIDKKYQELIAKADENFSKKNYSESKKKYIEALSFKPEEKYPRQKLKEIENISNTKKDSANFTNSTTEPNELIQKYTDKNKTKKDSIEYRVQFASSEKELDLKEDKFKNLQKISYYKKGNLFKYTSGSFNLFQDALNYQRKVREFGFNDAFVVSFKNGERIEMNKK